MSGGGHAHPRRHFGFVMEQTLGHVTHYRNLRAAVEQLPAVDASWYPLEFGPRAGIETLPGLRDNWTARASLRARAALSRDRASKRYDALFFHTQVTTLASTRLIRTLPSVISLDATPLNYDAVGAAYGHTPAAGPVEAAKRRLSGRSLRAADALVTWCEWARRSLVDDYGVDERRITVIAPGVNLALWPRRASGRVDGAGGVVQILFVGADFMRKGGEVLLAAFAALRDRLAAAGEPGAELHIVTKTQMPSMPGVHVYRGLGPNSDGLKSLYARADLFVLPTLADCFPLVVQEAMAAGLPVVSTRVGAIPEAVLDGQTGLLVEPGDATGLVHAVETLVSDRARAREMGAHGRLFAERYYDSTLNAGRILDIMMAVADTTAPAR